MKLLRNILIVIISPKYGWEEINTSSVSTSDILNKAFFPLLAILALTSFMPLVYGEPTTFIKLSLTAIVLASAFFFTYYITSYFLSGFYPEVVKTQAGQARMNDYILYNLIFFVLLIIMRNMLPIDFTPIRFLMIFLAWIAKRGVMYLGISEEKENKFVVIASAMMLLLPLTFIFIFDKSFSLNYGIF